LSASLLAGDRSLTNVVAHEVTHSWAGNYTTNSSWRDFWLNEGFTVYIERMILGQIHDSKYRDFESLIGYKDLIKTVQDTGATHEFTKLLPNLEDTDPDEAFSKIPYEKGSLFLRYLENKVGGLEPMQRWLRNYFRDYRFKSLSTEQMKEHFLHYFSNTEKVPASTLQSIDWDGFLNTPGLPAFDPFKIYDASMGEVCVALAKKWREGQGKDCTPKDLDAFQSKQKMYFLDELLTGGSLSKDIIDKLDEMYHLSSAKNVEIQFRYLMLCLKNNHKTAFPRVAEFLGKYGRGLYVKPLYKALIDVDYEVAKKVYLNNKHGYHSIIRQAVESFLKKADKK
jgi:leukotriene-A4 hydrolase